MQRRLEVIKHAEPEWYKQFMEGVSHLGADLVAELAFYPMFCPTVPMILLSAAMSVVWVNNPMLRQLQLKSRSDILDKDLSHICGIAHITQKVKSQARRAMLSREVIIEDVQMCQFGPKKIQLTPLYNSQDIITHVSLQFIPLNN